MFSFDEFIIAEAAKAFGLLALVAILRIITFYEVFQVLAPQRVRPQGKVLVRAEIVDPQFLSLRPVLATWTIRPKIRSFRKYDFLYYCTSLWQLMLFDCLNSMRSMLLSKGQLNFITRRVFRRHCGHKAEFKGRSLSVGLSTSKQNLIPQGRTT